MNFTGGMDLDEYIRVPKILIEDLLTKYTYKVEDYSNLLDEKEKYREVLLDILNNYECGEQVDKMIKDVLMID